MKNDAKESPSDSIKKLGQLIEGIKVAMLTTVDEAGKLHTRPMATQQIEFNGDLWFFTGKHSNQTIELQKTHQVQISYSDVHTNRFVSVSGQAEVIKDTEKSKELWTPLFKAWFPQGLNDPNLALLKVKVEEVEYWDTPSSQMVHLIGLTKAIFSGKGYEGEGTDHKKFKISNNPNDPNK
jgi:general stress protein 26